MVIDVFAISHEGTDNKGLAADQALRTYIAGPENALLKAANEALTTGTLNSESHESPSSGPLDREPLDLESQYSETQYSETQYPEPLYNPILVSGTTAVGKTHLLRLFTANFLAKRPHARLLSLNGAEFARSYAAAVELNATDGFRRKHRHIDLFVLDDLHELAGRMAAQQELLHTIDTLIESRSQILISSKSCVADTNCLLPGLWSRLSAGLAIPIRKPELTTRRVLLSRIADEHGIALSPFVADEILNNRNTETVPQLTSVLLELNHTLEAPVDQAAARRVLDRRNDHLRLRPRQIINQVARSFHIKSSELVGTSRRQSTVRARGVAVYLVRQLTGISFEQLGRNFGGRDHTTMLHAYRRTRTLLQTDPLMNQAMHDVTQRLGVTDVG